MKRITFLPLSLLILTNAVFGQYYIGNTAEEIIGAIQDNATMIVKKYDQNGQLILSWIENEDTKYIVHFQNQLSIKTYIVPLYARTFTQWLRVINASLPKAEGKTSTWISYTKTGTFQLSVVNYPASIVKCFEVIRTDEY
jgi:hypothetical protein